MTGISGRFGPARARAAGVGAALTLVLAGCGPAGTSTGTSPSTGTSTPTPPATSTGSAAHLPGMRWESYRDVELQVPADWGWGVTGEPWCLHDTAPRSYVGRSGPIATIGCASGSDDAGDPGFSVERAGSFVWFGPATDDTGSMRETTGDRLTITIGDAEVAIQGAPDLREKIAGTLREVERDSNGCPAKHPISADPAWRPNPTVEAGSVAPSTISACTYELSPAGAPGGRRRAPDATLLSSIRLNGKTAERALRSTATPAGSGPNAPESCAKDWAYGDDVIVLRMGYPGVAEPREVVLRYSGCDHHGFDDGAQVTRLTRKATTWFMSGANQVRSFSGEVADVMPLWVGSSPPMKR